MTASEQTAELAIDDLGLDLGTLEAGTDEASMPGGADAPTMLAGLDEDTRQLLARAEAERSDGGTGPGARRRARCRATSGDMAVHRHRFRHRGCRRGGKPGANGAGADAPTELVTQISPAPTQIAPAPSFDTSSTSRLAALNKDELDLDFADLGAPSGVNGMDLGPGAVDLDVGAASAGEGTFVQTQKLASDEVALPELEPVTMSEVGTKLDLARAYMDMGDPEGARSILEEVLQRRLGVAEAGSAPSDGYAARLTGRRATHAPPHRGRHRVRRRRLLRLAAAEPCRAAYRRRWKRR